MSQLDELHHQQALLRRRIKFIVEKGSIARLFKAGTNHELQNEVLHRVKPAAIARLNSREEYDAWLMGLIKDNCWAPYSRNGLEMDRWGYFAKLLNIVIYEVTSNRELLCDASWQRLIPWLHIPFDANVFYALTQLDSSFPACWVLKGMTEKQYPSMLEAARALAAKLSVPPIWFEDAWTS